jgi:2-alkenal reductase
MMLLALVTVARPEAGATQDQDEYGVVLTSQAMTQESETLDGSVADVVDAANDAVVTIYTFVDQGSLPGRLGPGESTDGEATPLGAGSGWIFNADGYVVTNAHVVAGAESFVVQYADGTQVEATLVGVDEYQDVAVLQLDLAVGETVPAIATIGDSSAIRPGDQVVAIGSPLGEFTNTVSDGIVGGLDRSLDTGYGYTLPNLIQHDAEISSGNSGGPLLNMQGEVIGMNVAKIDNSTANGASVSGLNFAIAGNTVTGIVEEIIETGTSVTYPYLGIQTGWSGDAQVVEAVEPGTPADEAGMQPGDVIVALDGEEISADAGLVDLLFQHRPGDTVTVTVERGGETIDITLTLGERPAEVAA